MDSDALDLGERAVVAALLHKLINDQPDHSVVLTEKELLEMQRGDFALIKEMTLGVEGYIYRLTAVSK